MNSEMAVQTSVDGAIMNYKYIPKKMYLQLIINLLFLQLNREITIIPAVSQAKINLNLNMALLKSKPSFQKAKVYGQRYGC